MVARSYPAIAPRSGYGRAALCAAPFAERGGRTMRLVGTASLAVLLLLMSSTSAFCECAWVLWNMSSEKPRTSYVDGAKFTAQQQCAAERDLIQLNADLAAKQGVPNFPGRESYICLPDTVDPRGPKGK